ncbi:hypothetical protein [Algoriphagus sp.]|uniref:hypothetical protein n=1 Tax=Algoriphagus sp. TaxID=1872435 RepID=UPI002723A04F|nr:hypothetical protein [Algoriphagus sp.]MDO8968628.1 hypothetical protein [Algoriphagus sp.]MDP3201369.1 hypothetical protein [Algoriphagus sp.]
MGSTLLGMKKGKSSTPSGVVGIVHPFSFPWVIPMAIEKFDPLSGVGDLKTIDLQTNDRGVVEPLNNPR